MSTSLTGSSAGGYGLDHLPYGVFSTADGVRRVGARLGGTVLDLGVAAPEPLRPLLTTGSLDALMAAGGQAWLDVRTWLTAEAGSLSGIPLSEVQLHLAWTVGDYVDFYASEAHATNVGRILRPHAEPLLPNWRHLPVGYHGRAGSVVVSGTPVLRPCGQWLDEGVPAYGPTRRLDLEAELGFVVGRGPSHGSRVGTNGFQSTVFGVVGLNDWSARDIQAWEYAPLGPHLGKSFATSISAWVTPLAALADARVEPPEQDPPPLDYLRPAGPTYDVTVEVELAGEVVARSPYRLVHWTPAQMLAHLTVNGARLRTGDLFASGTISGPDATQRGCLLELSWGGREPFLAGGRERTWLEDGDEVVLRYSAPTATGRLQLGEVRGRIEPALP